MNPPMTGKAADQSAVWAPDEWLADPVVFSQTHLPKEPLWQLRETPLTYQAFLTGLKTLALTLIA